MDKTSCENSTLIQKFRSFSCSHPIPRSVTVYHSLGAQVFAFKACSLMREDVSNRLITLPGNDTCISTQYVVAVIFNMRKKIKEIKISFCCLS